MRGHDFSREAIKEYSYGIIPLRRNGDSWDVLLIQHSSAKYWGFPKGHAENGESPREAARRELLEETNLTVVKFLSEATFEEHYQYTLHGNLINKTVMFFVAEVAGQLSLQTHEVSGARWVTLANASRELTYDSDRSICQGVLSLLGISLF